MRIAYVYAGNAPVLGRRGASVHVQEVVRALGRRGARVELVARRFGSDSLPGLEAVGRTRLARPDRAASETLDPNAELREALSGLGPLDLVYERFSLGSHAAMEHAREIGAGGVLELNGPRLEKATARGAVADPDAAEASARRAVAAATAVVTVSDGVARYARERFAAGERVHVIPNGVDPGRFPAELLERREARGGPFTVGFVGTFKAHHGLDTLVDAFALLRAFQPDARLALVGDGSERSAVEARLAELDLAGAAELSGAVPPAEVPSRLAAMDVGVAPFPLRRDYVSPLKVYEYLAAGLPVAASGAEQLRDLLGDGDAGLLCEPADPAALAEVLAALARDPERRARMGREGRRRVLEHHTWDAVAERILAVGGVSRAGAPAP